MTDRNKKIIDHFSSTGSWEEKYRKIIELGKKLPKFDEKNRQEKWLIKACQSPLWLKAEINESGLVLFSGDSDGLITKGLLALIIEFYTHRKPEEILKNKPKFIKNLELSQYLSARRTNGLQSLLDQILKYTQVFSIILNNKKKF